MARIMFEDDLREKNDIFIKYWENIFSEEQSFNRLKASVRFTVVSVQPSSHIFPSVWECNGGTEFEAYITHTLSSHAQAKWFIIFRMDLLLQFHFITFGSDTRSIRIPAQLVRETELN